MGAFISKQWDVKSMGDMRGKVVLVTGANTGMGYVTTEQLLIRGAKVYLAARSESKAQAAIAQLRRDHPDLEKDCLVWLPLDLSTLDSVRKGSATFMAQETRLDILVNNAASFNADYQLNEDGVELGVAINHLGHFALVDLLLPVMKRTASEPNSDVRIVTIASDAHNFAPSNIKFDSFEDFNVTLSSSPTSVNSVRPKSARYGLSKLMNIYFARELQRRLDNDGVDIISLSLHPGLVATENALNLFPSFIATLIRPLGKTPLQGATTALFAASASEVKQNAKAYKGVYMVPYGKVKDPNAVARDDTLARNLWKISQAFLDANSAK